MNQQNCIIEFHLNRPLKKNRSTIIIDDMAKLNQMNYDNVEIVSHYNVPLKYVNSITVSFVEGFNARIIVNSGKSEIISKRQGVYDFTPPKMEYNGMIFENAEIEKHMHLHKEKPDVRSEEKES